MIRHTFTNRSFPGKLPLEEILPDIINQLYDDYHRLETKNKSQKETYDKRI